MSQPGQYVMSDLGGGLNDGEHPSSLPDNQFAELYNFYVQGTRIVRRGGVYNVVRTPLAQDLNSVFVYTDSAGLTHVIMGGDGGLFRINSDGDVQLIPPTSAFSAGTNGRPWHMVQINGIGYAVRDGVGVRRFASDFHSPAGINPPTWTATLAQGAAGNIGAGDYIGVVTYRNSRTGAESNPGAASNTLTLAANKRINWSGLLPSTDAQVDQIRLWRTLADQQDEYFLVDTIAHTDSTYVDNKTTDEFGSLVSNNNGLPPTGIKINCLWDDSHCLSDGVDVFISEILLPESFSDTVLNAYRDDGHSITGLIGWNKKLIVMKTNKIHYFTRTGPRTFERGTISERHGGYSHRSLKVIEEYLYWFGGDNFYRSSGYGAEALVDTQVRRLLDRIGPGDYGEVAAGVFPALSLITWSVTLDSAAQPNAVIAYNYRTQRFSVFDHTSGKVPVDYSDPPANGPEGGLTQGSIYAVFNDRRVYNYLDVAPFDNDILVDDWTDSDGALQTSPIQARFKTKQVGRDLGGLKSVLRHVWMMVSQVDPEDLTAMNMVLSVYLNGSTDAYKTRTVNLRDLDLATDDWHVFRLSSARRASSRIQLGVTYSSHPAIEISQIALDMMQFERIRRVA